jgi:hypothetical protein
VNVAPPSLTQEMTAIDMSKKKRTSTNATGRLRVSRFLMSYADVRRVMSEFKAGGFKRIAAKRVKKNGSYTRTWRVSAVVSDIAAFAKWLSVEANRELMKSKERK